MPNLLPPLAAFLFFFLSTAGVVVAPSPFRALFILPIAGIALYLVHFGNTGDPIGDYFIGTVISGSLFSSIDYIVLTDIQNELYLVGQTEPISKASEDERVIWASKLFTSPRGIGWTHEPTHALYIPKPKRIPGMDMMPTLPILYRLLAYSYSQIFLKRYQDLAGCTYNPKAFPETVISLLDALRLPLLSCLTASLCMNVLYTMQSIVSIGVGKTDAKDWPPLFGSLSDAYTIRKCWGRTWHQLLRRMLSSHGKYLAHRVLRLKKGNFASSYVQLYTGFFISGVIHHTGDYMMSHLWEGRSLHFFLLQAVAITFEDAIIGLGRMLGIRGSGAWRAMGSVWCLLWFAYSMPIWLTPIFGALEAQA